jgi:hypothetical protein
MLQMDKVEEETGIAEALTGFSLPNEAPILTSRLQNLKASIET